MIFVMSTLSQNTVSNVRNKGAELVALFFLTTPKYFGTLMIEFQLCLDPPPLSKYIYIFFL